VHSIIYGAKKSFWWGFFNLFFPPISMPIFYYVNKDEMWSWAIYFLLTCFIFWGAFIYPVNELLSIFLIITGTLIFLIFKKPELLDFITNNTLSNKIEIDDYKFDLRTFRDLQKNYKKYLSQLPGKANIKYLKNFLENPDFRSDLFTYVRKYLLFDTTGKALIQTLDDERFIYFKKIMMNKYGISSRGLSLVTLFISEELSYKYFIDKLSFEEKSSFSEILNNIAYFEIESNSQIPDAWLQRILEDNDVHKKIIKDRRTYCNNAKEKIKIKYFEDSLHNEYDLISGEIDDDIRAKKRKEEEIRKANVIKDKIGMLVKNELDLSPENYIIVPEDYSRDSRIDKYYKRNFSKLLSRAFNGHCCKCGEGMVQLAFDHFWFPKSRGGNFLMRHVEGYYINNCVPLCSSCNSSKGNKEIHEFFDLSEIKEITKRSQSINSEINASMVDFEDPHFKERIM